MEKETEKQKLERELDNKLLYRKCLSCNHMVEINLNQFYLHHKNSKMIYPSYRNVCGVKMHDRKGRGLCFCDNPSVKLDRKLFKRIEDRLDPK